MQWFRMYGGTLNNPKAQKLSGDLFKSWINLLCVTSQCDGVIVTCDIPFNLRVSQGEAESIMNALVNADLMVKHDGYYMPKDWEERQFKSDTSAERTKKYREKKKEEKCDVTENVTVTPPDTEQIQSRTEQKDLEGAADAASPTHQKIKSDKQRGKRLSMFLQETFQSIDIPQDWGDWAHEELRLSVEDINWEWEKFRDWWAAASGQKGVKADWAATWRNWMRKKHEDKARKEKLNELYTQKRGY